jgi:hypothetical protein
MLKENDVVEILSFESSEWCRVQLGRIKGAVPTSNLRALPASGRILVALYDFDSDKPGHLPFRRDEHLTAFEQVEGWMRGFKGTRFGRFPVTYVRELNAEEEEEQVLLMGLQADAHRPSSSHHRRSKGNRPNAAITGSNKSYGSDNSDSDNDGKQLDTAIFRPDSSGAIGSDSDSDDNNAAAAARNSKLKKTVSVPVLPNKTAPPLPLPPKSPPPQSLTAAAAAAPSANVAAAAASAISAVLEGGDADVSTLPPSLAANISKLKTRTSDVRRRSAELRELESTLRAQSESQEAQSGQQRLRVKALESRATQLDEREAQLNQREAQLDKREHMLIAREEALRVATAELRQRSKAESGAPHPPPHPAPPTGAPPSRPPPPPQAPEPEADEERRPSLSVPPPPVPEDDTALSGPPPLPDEPTTMGGAGLSLAVSGGVLGMPPPTAVPIEQYLPMREQQGWSVQPPLPPHCESAAARAVHEAAAAELYGDASTSGSWSRDELRSALDELLGAIGGGPAALDRVRDAALRVIPVGAAAGRERDDVLRGTRCVLENVVSVIVFGEMIAANVDAADAQMAYATSSANASDMMDRLRLMLGVSDAHQQLKLNVSERVTSARRQSFVTVMKAMPVEREDDGDDDDDSNADDSRGTESEFDKFSKSTDVGQFFRSIIEKHGARFPAVQLELTNKLPTLVKDAHVTTVEQLMSLDKAKLSELGFTAQLTLFVQQLAKKHLASNKK